MPLLKAMVDSVFDHQRMQHHFMGSTWLTLFETDLGIKKKKRKAPKKGDDDFAAKLAALDLEKEGGEAADDEPTQDGDM